MGRGKMAAAAILAALAVSVGAPPRALAAPSWTLSLTPTSTTALATTQYTITVTDNSLPNDLGCVHVDVPASFAIIQVGNTVASSGRPWTSVVSGNSVLAHGLGGGDRLRIGESVTINITAQATRRASSGGVITRIASRTARVRSSRASR